jgi:2-keto-4-pentenoate hydratase/2-oxohepta-3-ene-1,7-dioic acid hydratase in catechol pathway
MRFLTFRDESGVHLGVLQGQQVIDVSRLAGTEFNSASADMLALIEAGAPALDHLRRRLSNSNQPQPESLSLESVEVIAPITRPRKNIFCVGRNYREHAIESFQAIGKEVRLPESPNIFTKSVTTLNGPYVDIHFDPVVSEQVYW